MYIKEPDVFRANISNKLNKIIKKKKTSLNLEKVYLTGLSKKQKKKMLFANGPIRILF